MQEEQDAELRYVQENSTAFADQEAPAEQEEPQPQEVCLMACSHRVMQPLFPRGLQESWM